MVPLSGTIATYKHRGIPYQIFLDKESLAWCVDLRPLAKLICNIPRPSEAVRVGQQILEDIWKSARSAPALPPKPATLALPAPTPAPSLPWLSPKRKLQRITAGRKSAVLRTERSLERARLALRTLPEFFTKRDLAIALQVHPSRAREIFRQLETLSYIQFVRKRPLTRGYERVFSLTPRGKEWVEMQSNPVENPYYGRRHFFTDVYNRLLDQGFTPTKAQRALDVYREDIHDYYNHKISADKTARVIVQYFAG